MKRFVSLIIALCMLLSLAKSVYAEPFGENVVETYIKETLKHNGFREPDFSWANGSYKIRIDGTLHYTFEYIKDNIQKIGTEDDYDAKIIANNTAVYLGAAAGARNSVSDGYFSMKWFFTAGEQASNIRICTMFGGSETTEFKKGGELNCIEVRYVNNNGTYTTEAYINGNKLTVNSTKDDSTYCKFTTGVSTPDDGFILTDASIHYVSGLRQKPYLDTLSYTSDSGDVNYSSWENSALPAHTDSVMAVMSAEPESASVSADSIKLFKKSPIGKLTPVQASVAKNGKNIIITPNNGFDIGSSYKIVMDHTKMSYDGSNYENDIIAEFNTSYDDIIDSLSFKLNNAAIGDGTSIVNGDIFTVLLTPDLTVDNEIVVYLCIREDGRLCSIKPVKIIQSSTPTEISLEYTSALTSGAAEKVEVELIVLDDYISGVPHTLVSFEAK